MSRVAVTLRGNVIAVLMIEHNNPFNTEH